MNYPPTGTRLKAGIIDFLFIVSIWTLTAFVIDSVGGAPNWLRGAVFVVMVYLYDPLSVGFWGGTLGHRLLGVEVRRNSQPEARVNLLLATLRVMIKYFLGIISVIVSYAREDNRAIHDLVCDSVVVYKDSERWGINDEKG